jgi:glycosyltransferase involved in cell wall biosynthesis
MVNQNLSRNSSRIPSPQDAPAEAHLAEKKDDFPGIARPLRVLHIGNIANNAYYNAKFLRQVGIEADVLCYDDYWVMSSPEWEEADIDGVPDDQYLPNWWAFDLKGYQRPSWFVQGPFELSIEYLLEKQKGNTDEAAQLWGRLNEARRTICGAPRENAATGFRLFKKIKAYLKRKLSDDAIHQLRQISNSAIYPEHLRSEFAKRCERLTDEFAIMFPERADSLLVGDLLPYMNKVLLLQELFSHYDIIQGYAVDPLYPMLADFQPYVAFEHGTLRDAPEAEWAYKGPFYDTPLGRITALSYAKANHVFITNADCLSSAQRLHLKSFEAMPHPFDETDFIPSDDCREQIRSEAYAEIVFFCPIRHDWIDKGVDKYIRILPRLRKILGNKFKVCFTPWGKEVQKSRQLIAELDCDDLVMWVGPFGRVQFARWLSSADVVFDQVAYPSFSGLTPRALSCGVPVISSYQHQAIAWMFPEPAPVLAASTEDEILSQISKALEPDFREIYRVQARAWVEKYHSSKQVTDKLVGTYRRLLNGCNP